MDPLFTLILSFIGIACISGAVYVGYVVYTRMRKKTSYEQKTVSSVEGNALINSGEAKFVSALPDGTVIIKQEVKKIKEVKQEEVPIEKVPGRVAYEIVEQKDSRTTIAKTGKVRIKKSAAGTGQEFIYWRKRQYFPNHVIKETTTSKSMLGTKKVERFFIRWNKYYSEAIDADGKISFSSELENFLMNDMVIQFRDAAITLAGLAIDRPIIIILCLAMVFGIPIGLSYNDLFHLVPNTVVHWVTRR